MGQSSNEVLNAYPSLAFRPHLESTTTVARTLHTPGKSYLCWQAILGREDYDKLCCDKSEVQVWCNHTGVQWSAIPFDQRTTSSLNASNEGVERVDLSLFEFITGATVNQVKLEASIPIPSSVELIVEFTYRVVHASGRIDWLGTNETNGKVVVSNAEKDNCMENWINGGNSEAFFWTTVVREPIVIAKLDSGAKWSGWAFKGENTGSSVISRFIGVTSETFIGHVVALALLPQAHRGTYVIYPPILYTAKNGTLSLEGYNVLLHPGKEELTQLNGYPVTSTWKDHLPPNPGLIDVHTSDFFGVSLKTLANTGRLYFLPITGAQSIVTLNSSEITSLVPSSSVLLFDSSLQTIKFLPTLLPTECLRIAVGPLGGEIIVVPAYNLCASIRVAFLNDLNDHGSTSELEEIVDSGLEHSPSKQEFILESSELSTESLESSTVTVIKAPPKDHSLHPALLLLAVHIFQYFWALLLSIISPRSLSVAVSERVMHAVPSSQGARTSPGLVFKVTGKSPLLISAKDASKLCILVDGRSLHTTPKDIGGGHKLIENTSEWDSDQPQRRIEILLHE